MEYFKKVQKICQYSLVVGLLTLGAQAVASENILEAKKSIEKGDYPAAIIYLKNQLKEQPGDVQAVLMLGKAYLETGNFISAAKEFKKAYKLNPGDTEVQLAYAKAQLVKRKYDQVNKILKQSYSNKEDESQRLAILSNVLLMQGKIADGKELLIQANEKNPDNQNIILGLAQVALLEKELQTAENYISTVLKNSPDNIEALKLKAELVYAQGNPKQTLSIYDSILKKNKSLLMVHYKRALIKLQLNDMKGAEEDLNYISDKINNIPQVNLLLAQIKLQQKDFKAARELSENVLNMQKDNAGAMLVQAVSNMALHAYNLAEKYFVQYLSVYPDDSQVQNSLANLYLLKNQPESAILILENINESELQNNAKMLTTLGTAYLFSGEYEKGNAYLEKAKQLAPDSGVTQQRLAASYIKTGELAKASEDLENLISKNKYDKTTIYALLTTYIKLNKLDKARSVIDEKLEQDPDDVNLYNIKAVIELMQGNDSEAKKNYQKALIRDPKFIPALMGLAAMELKKKNYKAVKVYYNKVISINEQYIPPYLTLAALAQKEGNKKELENILMTGLKNVSGKYRPELKLAKALSRVYLQQQQFDKILELAKEFALAYPEKNYAQYFLAEAQMLNGLKEEAEKTLNNIILNTPGDIRYRVILAGYLSKQPDKKEQVVRLYEEAQNIQPDNSRLYILEIKYLLSQQDYKQAHQIADTLKSNFPELSAGWEVDGLILLAEKNFDEAVKRYQQAYQVQPSQELLVKLTAIMRGLGKNQQVYEFLKTEYHKQPDNKAINFQLGNIYQQKQDYPQAIKHYKAVLAVDKNNIPASNNLAWVYIQQNDPQGFALAEKVYQQFKYSPVITDTYAYALLKKGERVKALDLLKKAAEAAPENYNIQSHYAEALYFNQKKAEAIKILTKITGTKKSFSEQKNAQSLLNKIKTEK